MPLFNFSNAEAEKGYRSCTRGLEYTRGGRLEIDQDPDH